MDQRNLNEIRVTWQLALFIIAGAAFAISLYAAIGMATDERINSASLTIPFALAGVFALVIAIAIWARMRQVRNQRTPDGQPVSRQILRQVGNGLLLCLAGCGIMLALHLTGLPEGAAIAGGCAVCGAGILTIGRAFVSAA